MARLRVGDIDIDGSNVTIGKPSRLPQPSRTQPPAPSSSDPLMWFKALPVATIGGAAAAIGGTLLAISGMPRSLAEYLVGGGFLLSSGAGMLVLAGAVVHQRRRATALAREREDNALVQLAERVRAAIVKANPENTLERISEQVGAAPRLTALALARLRKRGQLQEDLNTTSGDWYYVAVSPDAKLTGKNLDDALRELEGRNDR